jgi:hypothetical protein
MTVAGVTRSAAPWGGFGPRGVPADDTVLVCVRMPLGVFGVGITAESPPHLTGLGFGREEDGVSYGLRLGGPSFIVGSLLIQVVMFHGSLRPASREV